MADNSNVIMALDDIRVLDLAGEMGLYCVKLLADLGADVIKIEPPSGAPERKLPPFKDDTPTRESSLYFLHYNTNKRSITLDLATKDGQALFKQLVKTADVVVESFAPGTMESYGLGYESLRAENPRLIMCSITGFGQTGPRRNYKATDLTGFAIGMCLNMCGEPDKEPCTAPGQFAYGAVSIHAAVGIMVALHYRSIAGEGQYIDVSMQECVQALADCWITRYSTGHIRNFRTGNRNPILSPCTLYPAKDGYVQMTIIRKDHWRTLVKWMGNPELVSGEIWEELPSRAANRDVVDMAVSEFTMNHTKNELYEEGQKRHLPITPLNSPADFISSVQVKARGLFDEVDFPQTGKVQWFMEPLGLRASPARIRRPAPYLGQHNTEIYIGELGLSKQDLTALRAAGII